MQNCGPENPVSEQQRDSAAPVEAVPRKIPFAGDRA